MIRKKGDDVFSRPRPLPFSPVSLSSDRFGKRPNINYRKNKAINQQKELHLHLIYTKIIKWTGRLFSI